MLLDECAASARLITDQFSGPRRARGPMCVCVSPDNNFPTKILKLTKILGVTFTGDLSAALRAQH